ncbi:MAG: hypothetical protein D6772_15950 [Bacteroidetes bacterium]|nr:MAG: hypothetical protein D6772_15950 [Bacteroidota bacterium]
MTKFIFSAALLMSLFICSCDHETNCDYTDAVELNVRVAGELTVLDRRDVPVTNYPVSIYFQKHRCDGGYDLVAKYSGHTDDNGKWRQLHEVCFSHERDYLTLTYLVGEGATQRRQYKHFAYTEIQQTLDATDSPFVAAHQYRINR